MTALPSDRIYKGFWVNHSEGEVYGATITLDTRSVNILIAGMSLLISLAGEHLWGILSFTYYSMRANNLPRDRLFYQEQLLLRNTNSPASMMIKIMKLYWKSRNHVRNPLGRLVSAAILAMMCSAIIVVTSTLCSQIMDTSDIEVLARSQSCGFVNTTSDQWYSYRFTAAEEGFQYSRSCYNKTTTDPAGPLYVTSGIPFETDYVPCPFEDLCVLSEDSAIQMDTGRLNSREIFGINTELSDTVDLRKVTTCAPLDLSRFQNITDMDDNHTEWRWHRQHLPGEQMMTWNMGRYVDTDFNHTIFNESWFMSLLGLDVSTTHDPNVIGYYPKGYVPGGNFDPIAPFAKKDADTNIVLIGLGSIVYDSPVDDPVFAAHKNVSYPMSTINGSIVDTSGYKSDKLTGAIGCFEQYQVCVPDGRCTTPGGMSQMMVQVLELNLSGMQNATMFAIIHPLVANGLDTSTINTLAFPETLVANQAVIASHSLPSNQWEIEVKAWKAMILTQLQKFSSDIAVGPSISGHQFDHIDLSPAGPSESVLCHSQKMIASAGFGNIKVFGFAFAIGICILITLVNIFLTSIIRRLARLRNNELKSLEQWEADEMLHMQREWLKTGGIENWSTHMSRTAMAMAAMNDAALVEVAKSNHPAYRGNLFVRRSELP